MVVRKLIYEWKSLYFKNFQYCPGITINFSSIPRQKYLKKNWKKYFYNITSRKFFKYFFHNISPPNIYIHIYRYETYRISHVILKMEATVKNSKCSTN